MLIFLIILALILAGLAGFIIFGYNRHSHSHRSDYDEWGYDDDNSNDHNNHNNDSEYRQERTFNMSIVKGAVAVTFVFLFVLCLLYACIYKIRPGYAGVVYNIDGGVETEVLNQGWHVILPWKHVTEYPVSTETVYFTNDETVIKQQEDQDKRIPDPGILINSKDGKRVSANLTYSYHMEPEKLPELYTKFKGQSIRQIESDFIKANILMKVSDVTTQYSQMELSGNFLPEVNSKILQLITEEMAPLGIIFESVNINSVEPDEQTREAIQKVIEAQNKLEQAKVERDQAQVEADKARIKAEGEAKARLIEAESKAKANEMLQQSLTDNIIKQNYINKWSGELPKVVSGDAGLMLQMP